MNRNQANRVKVDGKNRFYVLTMEFRNSRSGESSYITRAYTANEDWVNWSVLLARIENDNPESAGMSHANLRYLLKKGYVMGPEWPCV